MNVKIRQHIQIVVLQIPVCWTDLLQIPVYWTDLLQIPVCWTDLLQIPVCWTDLLQIPVYWTDLLQIPVCWTGLLQIPVCWKCLLQIPVCWTDQLQIPVCWTDQLQIPVCWTDLLQIPVCWTDLLLGFKAEFSLIGGPWLKRDLTFSVHHYSQNSSLVPAAVDEEIALAFAAWANVTDLVFRQVSGKADINISFFTWEHGDGYPFDGPGMILGHASLLHGMVHFDDDEPWTIRRDYGMKITVK